MSIFPPGSLCLRQRTWLFEPGRLSERPAPLPSVTNPNLPHLPAPCSLYERRRKGNKTVTLPIWIVLYVILNVQFVLVFLDQPLAQRKVPCSSPMRREGGPDSLRCHSNPILQAEGVLSPPLLACRLPGQMVSSVVCPPCRQSSTMVLDLKRPPKPSCPVPHFRDGQTKAQGMS